MTPVPAVAILAVPTELGANLAMPVSENDQIIARLEGLGEQQVRLLVSSGGLPTSWNVRIAEWLATKDQEARRLSEASQAEQIEIARSASKAAERPAAAAERASTAAERQALAAERANTRATIALVIAIISIIATIIGTVVVHLDAIRQFYSG
jgi:hypothetical protein